MLVGDCGEEGWWKVGDMKKSYWKPKKICDVLVCVLSSKESS